jgi:hypothetical protein
MQSDARIVSLNFPVCIDDTFSLQSKNVLVEAWRYEREETENIQRFLPVGKMSQQP